VTPLELEGGGGGWPQPISFSFFLHRLFSSSFFHVFKVNTGIVFIFEVAVTCGGQRNARSVLANSHFLTIENV
jgi:hypothetical protein